MDSMIVLRGEMVVMRAMPLDHVSHPQRHGTQTWPSPATTLACGLPRRS